MARAALSNIEKVSALRPKSVQVFIRIPAQETVTLEFPRANLFPQGLRRAEQIVELSQFRRPGVEFIAELDRFAYFLDLLENQPYGFPKRITGQLDDIENLDKNFYEKFMDKANAVDWAAMRQSLMAIDATQAVLPHDMAVLKTGLEKLMRIKTAFLHQDYESVIFAAYSPEYRPY